MTSAAATYPDRMDVPRVVRLAIVLGVIQTIIVALVALTTRFLAGPAETIVVALLVVVGLAATIVLPGLWVGPRTIEGIATAAGIGLSATVVFLVLDVVLLQPLGAYTFRWREIGGGSNWWYHPVWWMAGTYLSWLGGFIFANQVARRGEASVAGLLVLTLIATVVAGALAVVIGFPGAGWNIGTFGVAVLPGLAIATLVSGLGARRP